MRRRETTMTEDGHFGPNLFGPTRITVQPTLGLNGDSDHKPNERIALHVASCPALRLPDATVVLSAEEARELAERLLHMAKWADDISVEPIP